MRRLRLRFGEPISHELHVLIEEHPVVRAIRVTDDGVFVHNRMNFAGADRAEQAVADRMPLIILPEWRNSQEVCHLRQSLVTLNHGSDVIEFRLVEIFAHLAFARCRCCTGNSAFEAVKFGSEILCALGLNAIF